MLVMGLRWSFIRKKTNVWIGISSYLFFVSFVVFEEVFNINLEDWQITLITFILLISLVIFTSSLINYIYGKIEASNFTVTKQSFLVRFVLRPIILLVVIITFGLLLCVTFLMLQWVGVLE